MDEKEKQKRAPILPLHPAVVERMFHPAHGWESAYREIPRGVSHVNPDIGSSAARFLEFMAPHLQPKMALDLGSSLGYSTRVLAKMVGPEGRVLAVERDTRLARHARENLKREGLDRRVAMLTGDARDVLKQLNGPFDFILLDVNKDHYVDLLEPCLARLEPEGHLMVDDISFLSRDFSLEKKSLSLHVARFVHALLKRREMKTIYIPLGDGFLLSRKSSEDPNQLDIFQEAVPFPGEHEQLGVKGEKGVKRENSQS